MKFIGSNVLSILFVLSLTSCATTIPVNGVSQAGKVLTADVVRQISMSAKIQTKCKDVDSIEAQYLKTNPVGTGDTAASIKYGSVEERWTVNLCGKKVPFFVVFTPDGEGGTYFRTLREN